MNNLKERLTMMRKFINLTYRNALKSRFISLFTIVGLSLALASTLILVSWVTKECSFDSFFKNKENIYRLNFSVKDNNGIVKVCSTPQGVGPEALAVFPEVENFTRIRQQMRMPFKIGNNTFYVDEGFAADSTFFSVFSFDAVIGDLPKALSRKDQVVIDEHLANKCFGIENPIGKHILIGENDYTVSAVIENVRENSHIQFHYLVSLLNLSEGWQNNKWGSDNCIQYLVFKSEINKQHFEHKLNEMLYNKNPMYKELHAKLSIQPLEEIHFSSGYMFENAVKGNVQNVYILISIAFLILLTASVNFTNMFISSSFKRSKSTGVKMVIGASRLSIIKEFLFEVLFFIIVSFIISVLIVKISLPTFNNLLNTHIAIELFSLRFLLISVTLIIITLVLSGFFPGFYITRFNPALIIKSGLTGIPGKKNNFQRGLVSFQFVIAIILIISVIGIQKQVFFLKTKQLGFDKENLIYINTTGEFNKLKNIKRLKDELKKDHNISGIAAQNCLPTVVWNGGYMSTHENPENKVHGEMIDISEDYFDVMKIQFIEGGHDFDYSHNIIQKCIINETAAIQLNLNPPYTGQSIFDLNENKYLEISGVIKDINTKSLDQMVKPCLYAKATNYNDNGIVLFRITENYEAAISAIKDYCEKNNSSFPFEYHFLDQTYDDLYKDEIRMQKLLSLFTILSIILTVMGLLAITWFIMENKTKEIGVRKINGAKTIEILTMLNKDFLRWLTIAFVIACPLAWYAMSKWLQNFAYKTELSWWIFAVAGAMALFIALMTVSWHSLRAATKNPVEALRYE